MKKTRLILAISLGLLLALNCYATDFVFMGFDEVNQRMFAVVHSDQPLHVYCTLDQSNPGGWIDPNYDSYGEGEGEVIFETTMSPDDPNRMNDIPEGQTNVISALYDFYNENYEYLYSLETHDSLMADWNNGSGYYIYQDNCTWDLPPIIMPGTTYCATICHGSRTIPVYCEDPGYNPDLLEITVMNGCDPANIAYFPSNPGVGYHCDVQCTPIDWSLFSWRKRVFDNCQLYLSLTYCGEGPGCVCIVRSDFWLPVDMNSFTAIGGDDKVTLNWNTLSERELTEFRVARSTRPDDGFEFVGIIPATNEPTGHRYAWVDDDVMNGNTYYYKLHIVDANGAHVYNDGTHAIVASATPGAGLATEYYLAQNYPNPFNSQTSFSFNLPASDHVTLKVFDLLGREVATVVDRNLTSGLHSINWSAEGLSTGVYMYTLSSGGFTDTKKFLLLK